MTEEKAVTTMTEEGVPVLTLEPLGEDGFGRIRSC